MRNRWIVLFSFAFFIASLFVGHHYWNEKLNQIAGTGKISETSADGSGGKSISPEKESFSITRENLEQRIANLPEPAQAQMRSSFDNQEPVQLVFVGSPAMGKEDNGWVVQAKNQLEELYGEDFLHLTIIQFDGTSTEFLDSAAAESAIQAKPDILFFEPLTLEDNGLVEIETSHRNILSFLDRVKAENPDVAVILQPPNPIYAATWYPVQVQALRQFAAQEGIPFFDHWSHWPDPNSSEITNYLNDEGLPNEKGHSLWANAVIEFFSGK